MVNISKIDLSWQVGAYISRKIGSAEWGDGVVEQLAAHLARTQKGLCGFTRPYLFRMQKFYETYRIDKISLSTAETIILDEQFDHLQL